MISAFYVKVFYEGSNVYDVYAKEMFMMAENYEMLAKRLTLVCEKPIVSFQACDLHVPYLNVEDIDDYLDYGRNAFKEKY